MSEIIELSKENPYRIESVIVVYGNDRNHYIEQHKVYNNQNKLALAEGIPISDDSWSEIAKMAHVKEKSNDIVLKGLMPSNLLYFNKRKIIWWQAAGTEMMHFVDGLHIPSGKLAHVPPLIYMVDKDEFYVFAFEPYDNKEKLEHTDLNTILYRPPFHNCKNDGDVCMGNTKIKKSIYAEEIMKNYQTAFWQSKFSHSGDSDNVTGNINLLWKSQVENKCKFPMDVLIKTKLTLKDLLK